jgi:MFS transporter, PAT family, beta-lactamase induction signal transducer AmpG
MIETTETALETKEMPAAAAASPKRKRTALDVLRALGRPKVAIMLALGVSSGLPFMLISNTLGFWLSENHIKLSVIGYLSWASLPYLWKFVWGALVDHTAAPVLARLGRRRSWMILTQILVGVGLAGMALSGPTHLPWLGLFALMAGIGAAMQDTVIDAWRIEIASDVDELGLLTSSYSLGYRAAVIATDALILLVATAIGWALSYLIYGAVMAVGVVAALLAREPARASPTLSRELTDVVMALNAARKPAASLKGAVDAVVGPFTAFFRTHGVGLAALMLLMITLYHLCDYMRGPMSNPYYVALHISKPVIAGVRGAIGLPMTFVGIALGGLASLRLGARTSLLLGAILQPMAVLAFATLGWHGGDYVLVRLGAAPVDAFQVIMGFDSLVMGAAGVTLIAYMSSLTSLGYTATQYALLTSAMAWSGKFLKGFSGDIIEALQHTGLSQLNAYAWFFVFSAAIGIPAIVVCGLLLAIAGRARTAAVAAAG